MKKIFDFLIEKVPWIFWKRGLYTFIVVSILIVVVPVVYYVFNFGNNLASSHDIWGQFGDFLNVFINIAIGVILGYISFITYDTTFNYNKLHTTPILSFSLIPFQEPYKKILEDSWEIACLTNAPAKDIHLRFWAGAEQKVSKWIKCLSILGDSKITLPWLRFAARIQVYYSDSFGEKFYRLDYRDFRGDPIEINKTEWQEFIASTSDDWTNIQDVLLSFNYKISLGQNVNISHVYMKEFDFFSVKK